MKLSFAIVSPVAPRIVSSFGCPSLPDPLQFLAGARRKWLWECKWCDLFLVQELNWNIHQQELVRWGLHKSTHSFHDLPSLCVCFWLSLVLGGWVRWMLNFYTICCGATPTMVLSHSFCSHIHTPGRCGGWTWRPMFWVDSLASCLTGWWWWYFLGSRRTVWARKSASCQLDENLYHTAVPSDNKHPHVISQTPILPAPKHRTSG